MRTQYINPMIHRAFDLLEQLSADELTRQRAAVREKALKNEMSLLEDARMEGREEGVELGEMIGGIRALQRVLHVPVERKETLLTRSRQELQTMWQDLDAMLNAHAILAHFFLNDSCHTVTLPGFETLAGLRQFT